MAAKVEFTSLLDRARTGDREAVGQLLQDHRGMLKQIARTLLDQRLQARFDDSDLVQQTCISVCRRIDEFEGVSRAQFVAWLRRIHENNIRNLGRDHCQTKKRDVSREVSPDAQLTVEHVVRSPAPTPSQAAVAKEDLTSIGQALQTLPKEQRTAVIMRHREGCSLAEIAERMGKSESAVVGLIWRGLQNLKKRVPREDGDEQPCRAA